MHEVTNVLISTPVTEADHVEIPEAKHLKAKEKAKTGKAKEKAKMAKAKAETEVSHGDKIPRGKEENHPPEKKTEWHADMC